MDLTIATAHSSMPPPDVGNRLLASLPEDDLLHLESLCEQVHSDVGDVLYETGCRWGNRCTGSPGP
eukprot:gene2660-3132_t